MSINLQLEFIGIECKRLWKVQNVFYSERIADFFDAQVCDRSWRRDTNSKLFSGANDWQLIKELTTKFRPSIQLVLSNDHAGWCIALMTSGAEFQHVKRISWPLQKEPIIIASASAFTHIK
ncbi:MAG: hypothetical protein ABFD89_17405 [Bryobacteraceae bacterium]